MIAINKTNPTTLKTYVLSLLISFTAFVSYGQAVNENFDGTYGTPGNVPPDFTVVGGQNVSGGHLSSANAILLSDTQVNSFTALV